MTRVPIPKTLQLPEQLKQLRQRIRGMINSAGCAAFALVAAVAAPSPAHASDWGCQVVLCLATPGSPTTYAACVPPITKLWRVLATGGSFPSCSDGGVSFDAWDMGWSFAPIITEILPGGTTQYFWIGGTADNPVITQMPALQVEEIRAALYARAAAAAAGL